MLKIYDTKEQIPEAILEHYTKRGDGKWEPQVEGINSIGGLIAKRDELLDKTRELPGLRSRVQELEALEVLSPGKIAVEKAEFDRMKAEHEAFAALGSLDEIKPKIDGFDELKSKDEARSQREMYQAVAKTAGFNEERFVSLAVEDKFQPVLKTVQENGKPVEKYFVTTTNDAGKKVETAIEDYVQESPRFKPFADTLTDQHVSHGTKLIKQGVTKPATPTLETEIAAHQTSGIYGL